MERREKAPDRIEIQNQTTLSLPRQSQQFYSRQQDMHPRTETELGQSNPYVGKDSIQNGDSMSTRKIRVNNQNKKIKRLLNNASGHDSGFLSDEDGTEGAYKQNAHIQDEEDQYMFTKMAGEPYRRAPKPQNRRSQPLEQQLNSVVSSNKSSEAAITQNTLQYRVQSNFGEDVNQSKPSHEQETFRNDLNPPIQECDLEESMPLLKQEELSSQKMKADSMLTIEKSPNQHQSKTAVRLAEVHKSLETVGVNEAITNKSDLQFFQVGGTFGSNALQKATSPELRSQVGVETPNTDNKPNRPGEMNDQIVFSRLPKDYFLESSERLDLDAAVSDIKKMREGFVSYMRDSHLTEELQNINDILQPSAFIARHFAEPNADFLFQNELLEIPDPLPVLRQSVEMTPKTLKTVKSKGTNKSHGSVNLSASFTVDISVIESGLRRAQNDDQLMNVNMKQEILNRPQIGKKLPEKELLISIDKVSSPKIFSEPISEKDQKTSPQKVSLPQVTTKNFWDENEASFEKEPAVRPYTEVPLEVCNSAPQDEPELSQPPLKAVQGKKKRAQTSKPDKKRRLHASQKRTEGYFLSEEIDASQNETCVFSAHQIPSLNQEIQNVRFDASADPELDRKLEADILDNVDINFIFNKGQRLQEGLIDPDRIYQVMTKLKDLAFQQLQKGSKKIDYDEIVNFITSKDSVFFDELKTEKLDTDEHVSEPTKLQSQDPVDKEQRWAACVGFLRNNPKLLLQMLPSGGTAEKEEISVLNFNSTPNETCFAPKGKKKKAFQNKTWKNSDDDFLFPDPNRRAGVYQSLKVSSNKNANTLTNPFQTRKQAQSKRAFSNASFKKTEEVPQSADLSTPILENKQELPNITPEPSMPLQSKKAASSCRNGAVNLLENNPLGQSFPRKLRVRGRSGVRRPPTGKSYVFSQNSKDQKFQIPNPTQLRREPSPNSKLKMNLSDHSNEFLRSNPTSATLGVLKVKGNRKNKEVTSPSIKSSQPPKKLPELKMTQRNQGPLSVINMLNDDVYKPILERRPTTASEGKKLASNNILSYNSMTKQSLRKLQYTAGNLGVSLPVSTTNYDSKVCKVTKNPTNNYISKPKKKKKKVKQEEDSLTNLTIPTAQQNAFEKSRSKSNLGNSMDSLNAQVADMTAISKKQETPIRPHSSMLNQKKETSKKKRVGSAEPSVISDTITIFKTSMSSKPSFKKPQKKYQQVLDPEDSDQQPSKELVTTKGDAATDKGVSFLEKTYAQRQKSPKKDSKSKKETPAAALSIDWAYTPLCIKMLQSETEFNKEKSITIFHEKEVDYTIDMMKNQFLDFKRTDIMRPFYLKALETLDQLLKEQCVDHVFAKFKKMYNQCTVENTLKLLLRCQLQFKSRKQLMEIFECIMKYELAASDMRTVLDNQHSYKVDIPTYNEIRASAHAMFEFGEQVFQKIKILRADTKSHYSAIFIFKKKDLVLFMKNEMSSIRKLVDVFRVKRVEDSQDSDKLQRYELDEEEMLEESEEEDDLEYYDEKGQSRSRNLIWSDGQAEDDGVSAQ